MESLYWRSAKPSDRIGLETLLASREEAWVNLIDRYETAGAKWYMDFAVLEESAMQGRFAACFYISPQGLAIIAVDPSYADSLFGLELIKLCRGRIVPLFCLMGPAEAVRHIQEALPRASIANTQYHLMRAPAPEPFFSRKDLHTAMWPPIPGPALLWKGLDIQRSTFDDLHRLIDLQIQYELEEVLVNGHRFDPDASRRQLEQSLKKQCIWHATTGLLSVAKAGTNARSWHHAQIGGVFTLPAWRNRGIAHQLMKGVLQDIFSAGLNACLFVKQSNAPAVRLYEKLGFSDRGALTISYY